MQRPRVVGTRKKRVMTKQMLKLSTFLQPGSFIVGLDWKILSVGIVEGRGQ